MGVLIDTIVFQWMISHDAGLALAHFVSFFAATVNYTLNSKWAFREHHAGYLNWHQFGRFLTVGALALLLRGGVLALLVYVWQIPPLPALFPAIMATAAVNYLGSAFYVFPSEKDLPTLDIRWRTAAIGIVIFTLLLHLVYFGLAQLIPDETYYWQYAQHMDLSFYDHPPRQYSPMSEINQQEFDELTNRYRKLIASQRTLLLSTASANGMPNISYAPFVRDDTGLYYIYVSELASHTVDLLNNPKASIMFIRPESESHNLFVRERVVLNCSAEEIIRDTETYTQQIQALHEKFGKVVSLLST